MKLLAIETATSACSAALQVHNEICFRYEVAPQKHAELILGMINDLLSEAGLRLPDLDCLAFGRGPGAFTGVRIAAGVIQGLSYGAGLPVVPVSTLAVLAQGATGQSSRLYCAIDARMQEVYWCRYHASNGIVVPVDDEAVNRPGQINLESDESWFGIGSGWNVYPDELCNSINQKISGFDGERFPHARDILPLALSACQRGETLSAAEIKPVYLRNDVTG